MEDTLVPIFVCGILFIGLPWLVMHYITKWKTGATLTNDDERMLGDMHELARRLEDRLETVERLVTSDHADFQARRLTQETEDYTAENIRKLERNR
jgi:phage shock protein B